VSKLSRMIKEIESPHPGSASQTRKDCELTSFISILFSLCIGSEIPPNTPSHQIPRILVSLNLNLWYSLTLDTVFDAKRLIGRRMDDPTILQDKRHLTYEVISKAGKPSIRVEHRGEMKEFVRDFIICLNKCLFRFQVS